MTPQTSSSIDDTRAALHGPIGESLRCIISADIRDVDDALRKGTIFRETLIALQVAHVAEHTCRLALKAEDIARKNPSFLEQKRYVTGYETDFVRYNDPVFESLGEEEYEDLRYAHAVRAAAQMYLNNEILAVNEGGYRTNVAENLSLGVQPAEGFKEAAAELFTMASDRMRKLGHEEAANKLTTVSQAVAPTTEKGKTPIKTVIDLETKFTMKCLDASIMWGLEYTGESPYRDFLIRLKTLVVPPSASRPGFDPLSGGRNEPMIP